MKQKRKKSRIVGQWPNEKKYSLMLFVYVGVCVQMRVGQPSAVLLLHLEHDLDRSHRQRSSPESVASALMRTEAGDGCRGRPLASASTTPKPRSSVLLRSSLKPRKPRICLGPWTTPTSLQFALMTWPTPSQPPSAFSRPTRGTRRTAFSSGRLLKVASERATSLTRPSLRSGVQMVRAWRKWV